MKFFKHPGDLFFAKLNKRGNIIIVENSPAWAEIKLYIKGCIFHANKLMDLLDCDVINEQEFNEQFKKAMTNIGLEMGLEEKTFS